MSTRARTSGRKQRTDPFNYYITAPSTGGPFAVRTCDTRCPDERQWTLSLPLTAIKFADAMGWYQKEIWQASLLWWLLCHCLAYYFSGTHRAKVILLRLKKCFEKIGKRSITLAIPCDCHLICNFNAFSLTQNNEGVASELVVQRLFTCVTIADSQSPHKSYLRN